MSDRHKGGRGNKQPYRKCAVCGAEGTRNAKFTGTQFDMPSWLVGCTTVSLCGPLIRADQGLLWGCSGLQNRGEQEENKTFRKFRGNRAEGGGRDAHL